MPRAVAAMLFLLAAWPAVAAAQSEPGGPGGTRLLFGPSARMLQPGRGYVAVDGLVLASVNVGVTEWFSMGAGTITLWDGSDTRPYWLIPKVRLYAGERTSVALCVVHSVVSGGRLGLVYLVSTTGSENGSLSLGGAVAYMRDDNDSGEDYTGTAPAFLVGGERRLHRLWSFVTENYVTTEGLVLAGGFRLHRRNFTADFSLVSFNTFGNDTFTAPALSVGWKF